MRGLLTHYDAGCVVDAVSGAGSPVKEGTPLVMEVVYVSPSDAPLSVEVPAPNECPVP